MQHRAGDRFALEADLRRAIDEHQFEVHYQPVVDLDTGRIDGAEALLRWNHPDRGPVSPVEFIPVAEASGLVVEIGDWVLATALDAAASWPGQLHVAVNVAPRQLEEPDFVSRVVGLLASSGLAPERLTIEITEGQLLEDVADAVERLQQLRSIGIRVAMDDFGTGFSSLSYLDRLPIDILKIDRAFVSELGTPEDRGVVTAIIDLARRLGMTTIAEGAEHAAQVRHLHRLGADRVQGYVYARPMPDSDLRALILDPAPIQATFAEVVAGDVGPLVREADRGADGGPARFDVVVHSPERSFA